MKEDCGWGPGNQHEGACDFEGEFKVTWDRSQATEHKEDTKELSEKSGKNNPNWGGPWTYKRVNAKRLYVLMDFWDVEPISTTNHFYDGKGFDASVEASGTNNQFNSGSTGVQFDYSITLLK